MVGREKIYTVSYADDIALLATSTEGLREMIKRLDKFLSKRGLEINGQKTKVMEFKKYNNERKRKLILNWKGDVLESVRGFCYLGYWLTPDLGDGRHIQHLAGKARMAMGKVWGIGERLFKDNWNIRMGLFDTLVSAILMYGAELWGWRNWKELEKIQDCFSRWTLKLERTTPSYIVQNETGRDKIALRAGIRAVKYDCKLKEEETGSLLKLVWSARKREPMMASKTEKENFLREKGWSWEEYERRPGEGEPVWLTLQAIGRDISKQVVRGKDAGKEYLRKEYKPKRNEMSTRAYFRLGNASRMRRYWLEEEETICRMCGKGEETYRHIFKECTHQNRKRRGVARLAAGRRR